MTALHLHCACLVLACLLGAGRTAGAATASDGAAVLFVAGAVSVTGPGGERTRIQAGAAWRVGHVLRTGADGRVQARFADGTLVSLSPASDVRLDAYRYDGHKGAADQAAFTVFRGSTRFLAGAQRSAGSALRVSTPAAAMVAAAGEFLAAVGGSLQLSVGGGQVQVRNDAGALTVLGGQRAFVKNRATPPILVGTIVPAPVTPGDR